MHVEVVYENGAWSATGASAEEIPFGVHAAWRAHDVQMVGWTRRVWIPVAAELADGVIGWASDPPTA